MNQINIQYYKTTIGELISGSFDGRLCLLDYSFFMIQKKRLQKMAIDPVRLVNHKTHMCK
ncbi:hypothetical protein S225a_07610 [Candidatus Brocadiaceae bacterium S225]|uniref:Uncharacterized protein n=1 Tax=Candidatus Scalindua brodae TaxID=237368 RepID=A0A0B0EFS3_9BACT|nr:MAG: hypothetical protein SCABRO_02837 [Candidatus Scalindua brodae]TWU35403.1 hypothetical protein S225a_07610 [Candidatus Brocadiaceae bacterium S225]